MKKLKNIILSLTMILLSICSGCLQKEYDESTTLSIHQALAATQMFVRALEVTKSSDAVEAMCCVNKWVVANIKYVADPDHHIPSYLDVIYNGYADCDGMSALSLALLRNMEFNGNVNVTYLSVFTKTDGHSVCCVVIRTTNKTIFHHVSNWSGVQGGYTSLQDMITKSIFENWTSYILFDKDMTIIDARVNEEN